MVWQNRLPLSRRNIFLDYLRGIAALAVLLFHYVMYLKIEDSTFGSLFQYGYMGVDLFFIISGYVIFMTLSNNCTPASFVISRFSRLYPTYIAAVLITSASIFFSHSAGLLIEPVLPETILFNLTMLQSFGDIDDIDGAYWTLAYELVFYTITGLAFFLIKRRSALYVFLLLYLIVSILYKIDRLGLPYETFMRKYFIVDRISWFISGISLYVMQDSRKWGVFLFFAAIMSVNFITLKPTYQISTKLVIENLLFVTMFVVTQFNLAIGSSILHHIFVFLGKISYPLYLIHGKISWIILRVIRPFDSVFLSTLFSLIVVIVLSIILHTFVEIKISGRIKSILTSRFIPVTA